MSPSQSGYLFAASTVCLWAGFVILARMAGQTSLSGLDVTALRFGTAALVLFPLWLFWKRVPLFTPRLAALAATGGLGYSLTVYSSFHFAPASHGAVLLSGILPFFVALFAWWILGEKASRPLQKGLVLIAGGVACMAAYGLGNLHESWPGDLLMILASALWGLYTVLVKRWGYAPWETTIAVALLSALAYLPIYVLWLSKGLAEAGMHNILLQAFYQGILVMIVAMLLFMQAMVRLGPTRVGAVMAVVPAVAGLGAVVLLGEPFSWLLVAGLALTSLGAWTGSRPA